MAQAQGILTDLSSDARALCQRNWWVFLVGGIASVLFGVLAFAQPITAWLVVATLFAAAILVDGVSNVVGSLRHRQKDGWWIMLLMGLLGVAVGAYGLLNPAVSMAAFVFLVAFEAGLLGIFLLMLGYKVRAVTQREWMLYVAGALSVLFGMLLVINPAAGGVSVMWMIAGWAVVTGALKIVFAFRIRALSDGPGVSLAR